eukprot:3345115-Rhodomonas_salina.2
MSSPIPMRVLLCAYGVLCMLLLLTGYGATRRDLVPLSAVLPSRTTFGATSMHRRSADSGGSKVLSPYESATR